MTAVQTISEQACFGGTAGFYKHASRETGTDMRFGLFLPPQVRNGTVPALYFLAGLTCTEETFLTKGAALRLAAELGLALVAPDTSPRGLNLPGETDDWDFGAGAGFYVDATQAPWAAHYRMYSYVNRELPDLVQARFPVSERRGISGHSMGGHGALVLALGESSRWHSVSALAPICNPCAVPWGQKAFGAYLGPDQSGWEAYDASRLVQTSTFQGSILVDQGASDKFLETQLRPETLRKAGDASGRTVQLRLQAGYDHSYWFVQSFIGDHLRHHSRALFGSAMPEGY